MGYYTRTMKRPEDRPRFFSKPPGRLLEDWDPELDAPIRGPLFPTPVFRALVAVFILFVMLCADWFGLLLLNSDGVVRQMGIISALRVTAALMDGVALTSALLIAHYKRLYTYTSEENVFFTLAFLLSFLLGGPCALAGILA